jgi:hypothetical protein
MNVVAPKIAPVTHWIGGWVDARVGLDDVEKIKLLTLPGLELRPPGRRARSQSLYRLRYPGSLERFRQNFNNSWKQSSRLGVVRGAKDPTLEKFTVTKPWRRPRPPQGCGARKEEEESF